MVRIRNILGGLTFITLGSLFLAGPSYRAINAKRELDKYVKRNKRYLEAKREYEMILNGVGLMGFVAAMPMSVSIGGLISGIKDDELDYSE